MTGTSKRTATLTCRACGKPSPIGAKRCAHCREPISTLTARDLRHLLWAVPLIGLLGWGVIALGRAPAHAPTAPPAPSAEAVALQNLSLSTAARAGALGLGWKADFRVANRGERGVKDVEILCVQGAPSGTPVGTSHHVLYEVFRADREKTVKDFDLGFVHRQTATVGCALVGLTLCATVNCL